MKVPGPAEDAAEVRRSFVESETKYRRLFEAAKDGILILDIDSGRITDVNPFLCSLLGFTAEEMIGNTVGQMSPFKDTVVNQSMLKLLQGQGYVRYENLPLETKDGRRIAVEFVCNVYEAGGVNVIQCNIRDITERKRTERQLQLMSSCVANLNDIVLVTETGHDAASNDRIILVNRAFERITGYQADEAIGRKASFLRGPKTNLSVVAELDLAVAERRPIRRQLLNYKKDGTEVWLDIDIVPVLDPSGECTHFAATERDITEERKSAARIVEQAAFLDKARDAIVVRDLDGLLLYWNEGAERIYGWNRHEALGRNSGVLLELDPRKLAEMNAGRWRTANGTARSRWSPRTGA